VTTRVHADWTRLLASRRRYSCQTSRVWAYKYNQTVCENGPASYYLTAEQKWIILCAITFQILHVCFNPSDRGA